MSEIVDTSIKNAVKGTALILSGTVISTLLLLTTKILIARNTTKEELGTYTLSVAVMSVLALIATLGVYEGIARYVAMCLGRNNAAEANFLSRAAIQINLASGIVVGLLLYMCSEFLGLSVFNSTQLVQPLRIISVSVPFFVMAQVLNAILRGHGIITSKIFFIDVGIPLFFLMLLGSALLLNLPFLSILYAHVAAIILGCVFVGSYGYRKIRLNPFRLSKARKRIELLRFSLPLLIGIIMTMIMIWTGTLMLGRYMGPKTVGVYDVSCSLSRLLLFPLAALEFVFLPIAGTLHSRGQTDELSRTYQVLTKWVFSITAPIFFILFCFPEPIITALFSDRFIDAAPALRILSGGLLFHSFWGPNGILMVVIGMPREISYTSIFGAVLNIGLNHLLIGGYALGIIGASIASVGTYVALNVLVSTVVYRKTGIHPFTAHYAKSILCAALMGLTILPFSSVLPRYTWMLPIYFIVYLSGYSVLLMMSKSFEVEDISLFRTILEVVKSKGRALKSSIGRPV